MDVAKPMTSTDLDEFNQFLDTWMQSDAPLDVPAEVYASPMGASNEELVRFQQQQDEISSAFISGSAFDMDLFQSRVAPAAPLSLHLGSIPSISTSKSTSRSTEPDRPAHLPEHSTSYDSVPVAPAAKSADAKKTRVLEKNRRAQKRFRDKQKSKMSDMEQQLEALQRNLESVTLEKSTYMRQNEVRPADARARHTRRDQSRASPFCRALAMSA